MRLGKTYSIQPQFPQASIVEIETDIQPGIFYFTLIGLADTSIKESRSRILAAIKNSGFRPPKSHLQKITTLLRPAGVKKYGSIHDLSIAVSYLAAQTSLQLKKTCFLGELTLEGRVVECFGIRQAICTAIKEGFDTVYYPTETNIDFADHDTKIKTHLIPVSTLQSCFTHLTTGEATDTEAPQDNKEVRDLPNISLPGSIAKALTLSLGGGHHLFIFGDPGTGKTYAAEQIVHLTPTLSTNEYTSRLLMGLNMHNKRPVRNPHPSSSYASMTGTIETPGEILRAHKGFLIMNEFAEFDRRTIETLRQPLEEKTVTLSRTKGSLTIPCEFTLIATSNLCRCGYYGSQTKRCVCPQASIHRYQDKISGPILERFEIRINSNREGYKKSSESTSLTIIKENIERLIRRQFTETSALIGENCYYKNLPDDLFWKNLKASSEAQTIIEKVLFQQSGTPRMKKHLWSVAKTLSDLRGSPLIEKQDIIEALTYRLENPKNL